MRCIPVAAYPYIHSDRDRKSEYAFHFFLDKFLHLIDLLVGHLEDQLIMDLKDHFLM